MKSYLIPLGTRCNAALITKELVNQARFPFDWVQMNSESMRDVILLEPEKIREYWTSYFSELDETKHHKKTQSWFPHDSFSTEEEIQDTIEKYVRRTQRFQNVLNTKVNVIYLITFGFPEAENIDKVLELTFAIRNRQIGPCSFIICNAMKLEEKKDDILFLYEHLEGEKGFEDWRNMDKRIELRIAEYLKRNQIEILPFQNDQSK